MIKWFRLNTNQYKVLSSAITNVAQAIILFALAAFFVPQTIDLPEDFSQQFALLALIQGLLLLIVAVIMSKKVS